MKAYDKEFYSIMEQFDKDIGECVYITSLEKEKEKIKGQYYTNGKTNEIFKAYMWGYSFGKYAGSPAQQKKNKILLEVTT